MHYSLLFYPVALLLYSCQGNINSEANQPVSDSLRVAIAVNDSAKTEDASLKDTPVVKTNEVNETKATETIKTEEPGNKKPEKKQKAEVNPADGINKVIIDNNRPAPETKGKTYRIKSFSVKGDILSIDVTYKGGCGQHSFELFSNGLLKKSLPPQYDVYLEHRKENETCNEDVARTLQFDLSPLNRQGSPKIIVNINNAENKAEWNVQ